MGDVVLPVSSRHYISSRWVYYTRRNDLPQKEHAVHAEQRNTNCYEFMLILSKGRPVTFNPLTEPTARSGVEGAVANKGPDAVNRRVVTTLNEYKTNI